MVIFMASSNLHETSRNLLLNIYIYVCVCVCVCVCVLDCMHSPYTKITYIWPPPYFFGAVPQSYLSCCLPGCSLHFAPNKTTHSSHMGTFLSWRKKEGKRGREGKRKIEAGYLCLPLSKCLIIITRAYWESIIYLPRNLGNKKKFKSMFFCSQVPNVTVASRFLSRK